MEGIKISLQKAEVAEDVLTIRVDGYIDTITSSELEKTLSSLLKQGRYKVVVDLGGVDYISSAGWGLFISGIKEMRENGGDLKLTRMIPPVYEIYQLLEFDRILEAYPTLEEAQRSFSA